MDFQELTPQEQLDVVIDLHQKRDALLIDLAASLEREDALKQQLAEAQRVTFDPQVLERMNKLEQQRDELKETLELAITAAQKAEAELIECIGQRDELLAALEKIADVCNGHDLEAGWAFRHARAAIEQAEPVVLLCGKEVFYHPPQPPEGWHPIETAPKDGCFLQEAALPSFLIPQQTSALMLCFCCDSLWRYHSMLLGATEMSYFYNVLTNPPRHLCIHVYAPCIDLLTHRTWRECKFCGAK